MPALGATLNPLMLNPGNATASCTPGCFRPISDMRRITASVRSSDAASGSWAKATRYCLSWVGTKPVGTLLKLQPVRRTSPAYTSRLRALLRITPPTPVAYLAPVQANTRLNGRKSQPIDRSIVRANQSLRAWWSLSNTAHNAGERVSELNAEITVEMAMVMANCL